MSKRFTKTFLLMHTNPEAAVEAIRKAYAKHRNMAKTAEALDISVSQLRVHCRRLHYDPVRERRAQKTRAANSATARMRTSGGPRRRGG